MELDRKNFNVNLKTNIIKSTGEAQSACNYLKSRTDYTTQCQFSKLNAQSWKTTNSILHIETFTMQLGNLAIDPQKLHARSTLTR
jgi:hypothetical protein